MLMDADISLSGVAKPAEPKSSVRTFILAFFLPTGEATGFLSTGPLTDAQGHALVQWGKPDWISSPVLALQWRGTHLIGPKEWVDFHLAKGTGQPPASTAFAFF
jgi:hypothetical protein